MYQVVPKATSPMPLYGTHRSKAASPFTAATLQDATASATRAQKGVDHSNLQVVLRSVQRPAAQVRKMLFFIPFLVDDSHLTLDLYIYLSHFHLFSRLPLTRLRQPHNACFILFFFPSILLLLSYLSCIPLLTFPSKHQKQIQ